MLAFHDIDPVALSLGPLKIHWYGITYLAGFAMAWWLGLWRAKQPNSGWSEEQVYDLIFYIAVGLIVGGRLGYMLFYNPFLPEGQGSEFWEIWKGGMSFHGALIGIIVAVGVFARKFKKTYFEVGDFLAPLTPLGLGFGRIGNFINGELWGKVSDAPWAMVFPTGGPWARHPSMLYEAVLEGLVLFLILWFYTSKPRPAMAASGLFLFFYGVFRFAVEFVREPDRQLGYLAFDWVTMGQVLSLPMVIAGLVLIKLAYQRAQKVV